MNKTVNINLGGFFYHIDEDAYQKLSRYFDAIKRSLKNSNGQDEIIKDIELRVSELFSEKQKSDKHVIGLKEVDEVIAVMGQPEDYRIDDEQSENQQTGFSFTNINGDKTRLKKLYRDKDHAMVGGVLAGLGHYFGVDKSWFRLIFLCMISFYGTGFLVYIILWIVIPEAVTTTEKLEMTGEPVTISNIEKKVRQEFENVSHTFSDFQEKNKIKNQNFTNSLGDFILTLLSIFLKFIGGMLIFTGFVTIVALLIGVFTLGNIHNIQFPWTTFIETGNYDYPIWTFGLTMFFVVGIPFFVLILLGLKLVSPSSKSIGNIAKNTLLAIWILSLTFAIAVGVQQIGAYSNEGRVVKKQNISLQPNDTLQIKFRYNENFANDIQQNELNITEDSLKNKIIFSNNVHFEIKKSNDKMVYIQIEKQANGSSLSDAKQRAERINYGFKMEGNQIWLDNYLTTNLDNKFRDQEVNIILYVPKGLLFKVDENVKEYDESDNDFFNLHYSSSDYIYKVGKSKVFCTNCPDDENDYDDVNYDEDLDEMDIPEVNINEKEINIKTDTISNTKGDLKELKISKDGIIIKTK